MRFISPMIPSPHFSAPQPIGSPSSRATTKYPAGEVISSSRAGFPFDRIEACVETFRELPEVSIKAASGVLALSGLNSMDAGNDGRWMQQPLDLGHRGQQPATPSIVERCQYRFSESVGNPVVGNEFRTSFARQADLPATAVAGLPADGNELLCLQ